MTVSRMRTVLSDYLPIVVLARPGARVRGGLAGRFVDRCGPTGRTP